MPIEHPGVEMDHPGSGIDGEHADFGRAMRLYMELNGRPFPTWSEVLEVVRSLGYRKVAKALPTPRLADLCIDRRTAVDVTTSAPGSRFSNVEYMRRRREKAVKARRD
jgi:hypothetical protein